jgi:hypothetical protein
LLVFHSVFHTPPPFFLSSPRYLFPVSWYSFFLIPKLPPSHFSRFHLFLNSVSV